MLQEWLAADERFASSRLVFVTSDAAVQGLVRSAQVENPGMFGLVDAGGDNGGLVPAGVWASEEPQLLVRDDDHQVLIPRLARLASTTAEEMSWGDGAVLVTGGTGGLGQLVTRHLVARYGVRDLVLVNRSGHVPEWVACLDARVTVEACDLADRDAVSGLVERYADQISSIVHLAGALDDGVVSALSEERLDRVWGPKADGAWHLHELTAGLNLHAFVVFSSAAGTFGSAGQANYAAANGFLDGLMAQRRANGLPGVSIAWGPWQQDAGMTGELSAADRQRIGRAGLVPLSAERGLELFDAALASGAAVVVPLANIDTRALRTSGDVPTLLRGLVRLPAQRRTAGPHGPRSAIGCSPHRGTTCRGSADAGPRAGGGRPRPRFLGHDRSRACVQRVGIRLVDRGGIAGIGCLRRPAFGCRRRWCSTIRPRGHSLGLS